MGERAACKHEYIDTNKGRFCIGCYEPAPPSSEGGEGP